MSLYSSYLTLLHGGAYDSVDELWGDEIRNFQIFKFGDKTTITYTYLSQMPLYYIEGQDSEATAGYFRALSENQTSALNLILGNINNGYEGLFEDVANVVFSSVNNQFNPNNVGAITFGQTDAAVPAYAFNPWSFTSEEKQGDVWLSYLNPNVFNAEPGNIGFSILLHEIGHALGLEHPWAKQGDEISPHLSGNELNYKYTVMVDQATEYNHPDMYYDAGIDEGRYIYSLGLYDIAALQAIYGADMTTRSGDTTYKIGQGLQHADTPFIYTVWDGGGNDTIDATGYADGVEIDLREGRFSSIGKGGGQPPF